MAKAGRDDSRRCAIVRRPALAGRAPSPPAASSSPCCRRPSAFAARAGGFALAALSQGARRGPAAEAEDLGDAEPSARAAKPSLNARALWLGPDEWLVIDEGGDDPLAAARRPMLLHAAVDIAHRNIALAVTGPAPRTHQCRLPAGPVARGVPGRGGSRTILGKIEIVLWRRAEDAFRVECWRSFSDYVFTFLSEAARGAAAGGGRS